MKFFEEAATSTENSVLINKTVIYMEKIFIDGALRYAYTEEEHNAYEELRKKVNNLANWLYNEGDE